MAKLKYTAPVFRFHQIPLVSGAGTGCAYDANASAGSCAVLDPDLGMRIFTSAAHGCQIIGNPEDFCYTVPMADYNIYMS